MKIAAISFWEGKSRKKTNLHKDRCLTSLDGRNQGCKSVHCRRLVTEGHLVALQEFICK